MTFDFDTWLCEECSGMGTDYYWFECEKCADGWTLPPEGLHWWKAMTRAQRDSLLAALATMNPAVAWDRERKRRMDG